jgi:predicted  nucleic acid-binding Zn-ribbon protein
MLREELAELDRRISIKKENIKLLRREIEELTDDKTRVEIKRNVKNHNHIWGTSYDTNV